MQRFPLLCSPSVDEGRARGWRIDYKTIKFSIIGGFSATQPTTHTPSNTLDTRILDAYLNKHLIDQLSCSRDGWALEYNAHWQTSSQGFDLDPHLPCGAGVVADTAKAQPVRYFFECLLPEVARGTPRVAATALEYLT